MAIIKANISMRVRVCISFKIMYIKNNVHTRNV